MNDETVDYINQQLEILADSLPSSFSSLNVYLTVSSFMEKKEEAEGLVLALCHILSSCSPDFASYGNCSDVAKVLDVLSSIGYSFSTESSERLFDANVYLIAELQSCIMAGNIPTMENSSDEAMDIDDSEKDSMNIDNDANGRIAIQLDKICRLLKIDSSSANDSLDVIALVKSHIDQIIATHPYPEQILHPQTILPSSTTLTDAQKATQQHLEEAFQQDFAIRRQMMLTRFEVTLESLLGEDEDTPSAEDDETARVRAAIKAQLKSIKRQPFLYRWEDALQAPLAIFYEQGKKVTGDTYSSAGSVVKKVIVGPVPDRGGRVHELRQKKLFEEKRHGGRHNHNNFQKNKQQGSGKNNNNNNRNGGGGSQSGKQQANANNNNNDTNANSSSNSSGRIVTMTREEKAPEEHHQRKKGRR